MVDSIYQEILSIYNLNGSNSIIELVGHSLGGKLAVDLHHKLIENDIYTNIHSYIFNPYFIHDEPTQDMLNNLSLALADNMGYEKYLTLKTNITALIIKGDIVPLLYRNNGPGTVLIYPAVDENAVLDSFSGIAYSAIHGQPNHTITNFMIDNLDTTLTLSGTTMYDSYNQQTINIDPSYIHIVSKPQTDMTALGMSTDTHLQVKAVSNSNDLYLNNVAASANIQDTADYTWLVEFADMGYFAFNKPAGTRHVTPIYKLTNSGYTDNILYVYFRHYGTQTISGMSVDLYYIIKLSNLGIFTDANSMLTAPEFTLLKYNKATGIRSSFTTTSSGLNYVSQDVIDRRLWTFYDVTTVVPFQGAEEAWVDDYNRRMIHIDNINDTDVTIGFDYYSQTGSLDSYNVPFYLYDIGGGNLKWGHINVGGIENYKISLHHTTNDLYHIHSNTYDVATAMYTPTYEICYYDTNRYLIRNTDVINSGTYLKKPTFDQWNVLQLKTVQGQLNNSSSDFLDMDWVAYDPLTESPDDFLFNIDFYSNIQIPALLGDSLTNNVGGVLTNTFLTYPQYLRIPNGENILTIERNGNLIIWTPTGAPFHTNSYNDGNALVIKADGNLVVFGGGTLEDLTSPVKWNSGTGPGNGSIVATYGSERIIKITDDAKFQIYNGSNSFIKEYS
jgi:hypothetical protein